MDGFIVSTLPRNLQISVSYFTCVKLVSTSDFSSVLLSEAVSLLINNFGFKYKIFREMWL